MSVKRREEQESKEVKPMEKHFKKMWSKEPNAQEESKIGTEEGPFELF